MSSTSPCPGPPAYFSCHQICFKLFWRNQSTTTEAFKKDARTEQNLTAGRETWPRCFNWLSRTNTHSRNLSALFFFRGTKVLQHVFFKCCTAWRGSAKSSHIIPGIQFEVLFLKSLSILTHWLYYSIDLQHFKSIPFHSSFPGRTWYYLYTHNNEKEREISEVFMLF